jgi:hypothetical protein
LLENQSIMRNIRAGCRSARVPPSKRRRGFLFKSAWCCQYDGQDRMVHSSGKQVECFAIFVYAICKQSELQNAHFSAILYRSINGFSSQMPSTFCRMIGLPTCFYTSPIAGQKSTDTLACKVDKWTVARRHKHQRDLTKDQQLTFVISCLFSGQYYATGSPSHQGAAGHTSTCKYC